MNTKMNIRDLIPYDVKAIENVTRLDANESSFNMNVALSIDLNRYPDNQATALRTALAEYLSVSIDELVIGNGSSEMIELLFRTFIEKGDTVLGFEKSFAMYNVFSTIYEASYETIENDYTMDMDKLITKTLEVNPKMVMICNPNNPTGYLISKQDIERLLKVYSGLVVIDEAYIEFTEGSMLNRLGEYDNLVILRTFSKAWGLAGARVGYMIANEPVITNIKKVKAPYNLNILSQQAALIALQNKSWMQNNVDEVIKNRERLYKAMYEMGFKVFKSFANFLYFEAEDSLYNSLLEKGVLIRAFGSGKYRVTIGSEAEINQFIDVINLRIAV